MMTHRQVRIVKVSTLDLVVYEPAMQIMLDDDVEDLVDKKGGR
jgi:hypothetical protein